MITDDDVIARLRAALDDLAAPEDLTTLDDLAAPGEPSAPGAAATLRRPDGGAVCPGSGRSDGAREPSHDRWGGRRWGLVAAAALVAVTVGTVALVAGRDDRGGRTVPASPVPGATPIPPSVTTTPAPDPTGADGAVPWYSLDLPGLTGGGTLDVTGTGTLRTQAWATDRLDRVLVAVTTEHDPAQTAEDIVAQAGASFTAIEGVSGDAWMADGPGTSAGSPSPWALWLPSDSVAVNLFVHGFTRDDLAATVRGMAIGHDGSGPYVSSPLSSLPPLGDGTGDGRAYAEVYRPADTEPATTVGVTTVGVTTATTVDDVTLTVTAEGELFSLRTYASWATSIEPVTTPFGDGLRLDLSDGTSTVWWAAGDGPWWAGVRAPTGRIDDVLAHLTATTAPTPGPTPSGTGETTAAPPATPDGAAAAGAATTGVAETSASPATMATTVAPATTSRPETTAVPGTATATTVPPAPTAPAASASGDPAPGIVATAFGSSAVVSAAAQLGQAGIAAFGDESWQGTDVADRIEQARAGGELTDLVVVDAATNGTIDEATWDRILAATAGARQVVVLTTQVSRAWTEPNNATVRALPERAGNVTVLDWAVLADSCPGDCFHADGFHLKPDGQRFYAEQIVDALDRWRLTPGTTPS